MMPLEDQRPRPALRLIDLVFMVVLSVVSVKGVGVLGELLFHPGSTRGGRILFLLTLQGAALIAVVYVVAIRRRGLTWADLGLRPLPAIWRRKTLSAAVLAFILTLVINVIVQRIAGQGLSNPQFGVIAPDGFSWPVMIGMLLVVGGLMPLAEELMFRGVLYPWLRARWGVAVAAVVSAALFSVLHGIPWLIPAIFSLGVILALLYERSGSLWSAVIAHGLYNAVAVVLLYIALAAGLPAR